MMPILATLIVLATTPAKVTPKQTFAIHCPPFIQTSQSTKTKAEGWATEPVEEDRNNLQFLSFSVGPPGDRAVIVSDEVGTQKEPKIRWEFSKNETIWVSCHYTQTTVTMIQQLPAGMTRCELTHKPMAAWMITSVRCS